MAHQRISLLLGVLLVQILCVFGDNCNLQYFTHYEQKSCKPVLGENNCPVRFECEEITQDPETCVYKGKTYKDGESVDDTGPCRISCTCRVYGGSAQIECSTPECFQRPANESCYLSHDPSKCCPTQVCPNENEPQKTCSHKGKEYKIGEHIETSEVCKSCICTEEWAGEDGPGCSTINCEISSNTKWIRKGCLPIYVESHCCVIETYCDGVQGSNPVTEVIEDKGNYCKYQGKYYEKGSTISLDTDEDNCTACECTTPPDFTCVRKSCSYKSGCTPMYKKGQCCPDYECP